MKNRIVWIDLLRGFCMMLILWFHTEVYYAGHTVIPYDLYVVNALTTFYFISGYLFYSQKAFSLSSKLVSIARGIVLPYFFFTLLLAFPKALMNHTPVLDIIIQILQGNGSWFVTSLITAEILFACALCVHKKWVIHCLPIVSLIAAWLLTGSDISMHHNYWNFHNAFIGLIFMYLGYEYHQHENRLHILNRLSSLLLLLLLFILIKVYVLRSGISLLIEPVMVNNYPVFLLDTICSILLAVGLFKQLPSIHWLQWVGRHSLVYYFFCGAVPMLVTKLLSMVHFPYHSYWQIPVVFVFICLITSAIVWISYRFLPFLNHRR